VGFIALGGIGVLNGVVMANEVRGRIHSGQILDDAILKGSVSVFRAVLTTACVAALGFLPMALTTSSGAEVQRPLATAVVVGMLIGFALTIFVFPGILALALRGYEVGKERALDADIIVGTSELPSEPSLSSR
jgi:cobalt-zinc-cadmium resistance protein CzcA